jgi:hypothetical protein
MNEAQHRTPDIDSISPAFEFSKESFKSQTPLLIQPKLSVGAVDDPFEREADAMADRVMRMPETSFIQRKCASCEEEEQIHRKITPFIQKQGNGLEGGLASESVTNQINASRGGGSRMPENTLSFMESRFNTDFSGVKIHTDSNAVQMSRELNAQAFTVGSDIYFNSGKYAPESASGKHLLAHELTHTVQQGGSVGLAMRRIQRSVNTWGGTWDTDQYDLKQDEANGTVYPASMGVRGVDITLKFTPNTNVDAELIGLTQSVQAFVNGTASYTNPTNQAMSITAATAKSINTGTGETDEGTAIDRAPQYNNPIYPVSSLPSTSLEDTTVSAGWGQLGWNNTTKTPPKQDATLIDTPRRTGAQMNARHVFETTALATKGTQAGTYYGSVRWGWRTDATGTFTKIPLSVVSQGVPSSTFLKSAELWNAGKSSTGADTVDLPIVDVKVTTAPITAQMPAMFMGPPLTIPAGTRVQIIPNIPYINGKIRVVDGSFTGRVLEVLPADMANIRDERA